MKKLLPLLFIISGCCSMSKLDLKTQVPINPETKKVDFSEKQSASGTQKELYSKAREWYARTFVSSKSALEMDDREAGKLIAKGNVDMIGLMRNSKMFFLLSVYVKDGAYKYSLSDIHYEFEEETLPGSGRYVTRTTYAEDIITPDKFNCNCMTARARTKWRDKTIQEANRIGEGLRLSMNKKSDF